MASSFPNNKSGPKGAAADALFAGERQKVKQIRGFADG
jgi:hypothetical protein